MSITRVTPGLGIWVKCDGTDNTVCKERRFTANIIATHNRAYWAKEEGWGRGARSSTKRWDLCPAHLKQDQKLAAKIKADKEKAKKQKAEKLAKLDAKRKAAQERKYKSAAAQAL